MSHTVTHMAQKAKKASTAMAKAPTTQKDEALDAIMRLLGAHSDAILDANRCDILSAQDNGVDGVLVERLSMQHRLDAIIADVGVVRALSDPIGECFDEDTRPNGLQVCKRRTPLGVLGVVFESRPNVAIDISALAIKSGNCAILRGGSETVQTNRIVVELIQQALAQVGLPTEAIQLIADQDRARVMELLQLRDYVDLIVPRGGHALQQFCCENSTIPVVVGGAGICHLYVDETADVDRAIAVIRNAKTQRPTVCNALDTLLVHRGIATSFIPKVKEALGAVGVTFRFDEAAWDTEWLGLTLGIKVVDGLDEAIDHIQAHSRGHSDGILTEDRHNAERFVKEVDSAAVYVNASTRFTDGGQLGLGSEVAVSTQKVHARGPMGLKELTSYKWVIQGNYQIRT